MKDDLIIKCMKACLRNRAGVNWAKFVLTYRDFFDRIVPIVKDTIIKEEFKLLDKCPKCNVELMVNFDFFMCGLCGYEKERKGRVFVEVEK